jgi:hypothetical protein
MGKQYASLSEELIKFIANQKIFFVATATRDSRVNVSPKGMDSLRILNNNRAIWLNVTGSGNETSAHVQLDPRMTIMFCAFEEPPLILRLYGTARVVHKLDGDWKELFTHFNPLPGARQIFDLSVEMVQTSCGMATPYFEYSSDRELLSDWAKNKGDEGLTKYWKEKNQSSIDNIPTNIMAKNVSNAE